MKGSILKKIKGFEITFEHWGIREIYEGLDSVIFEEAYSHFNLNAKEGRFKVVNFS